MGGVKSCWNNLLPVAQPVGGRVWTSQTPGAPASAEKVENPMSMLERWRWSAFLLPVPILGATLRRPLTPFVRFGHIPLGYRSYGRGPGGQRVSVS